MRILLLFAAILLLIDFVDCVSSNVSVLRRGRSDASAEPRLLKEDDSDQDKNSEDAPRDNSSNNNKTQGEGTADPGSGTGIEDCPTEKECEKAKKKEGDSDAIVAALNKFMKKCLKKLKKKCKAIIADLAPGAKPPKRCKSFPDFVPTCLKKWQKRGN